MPPDLNIERKTNGIIVLHNNVNNGNHKLV